MPDSLQAETEADRRLKINLAWRQWAFEHALLTVANKSDLGAVFINANAIMAWMFGKL
jgi:hypothetical protein